MESEPKKEDINVSERLETEQQPPSPLDFGSAFAEGREGAGNVPGAEKEVVGNVTAESSATVENVPAAEIGAEMTASASESGAVETAAAAGKEAVENAPGPSNSSDQSNIPQTLFYIKRFQTNLKEQPIILQSVNGPCPLIAIINCLLLQQRLDLSGASECITASSLCSLLGNYLLDRAQQNENKSHSEQYILDCMERFVQIQTGIDVNVRFNSVEGFEYTPELSLFDLAQVRLLHGWVVDPQDTFLSELIGDLTYNQLVEKTMEKSSSTDTKEVSESFVLKEHLESSQLTVHGICEINGSLLTGDIVVLFRNNHFSTITKQKDRLYVLVTDIGWAEEGQVVWETLDSTCNSSSFVDGFFNSATTSVDKTTVLADEVSCKSPFLFQAYYFYPAPFSVFQQRTNSVSIMMLRNAGC